MKKGMFKLMGIIVMGAVIGFFTGCDLTGGNNDFNIELRFIRIDTGYTVDGLRAFVPGMAKEVVIPAMHNGLPVVAISSSAFSHGELILTSVTIPNNSTFTQNT